MVTAAEIKEVLRAKGAALVGIAPAMALPEVKEMILDWERKGYLADMGWVAGPVEKRTNPGLHVREARSIVATAWSYASSTNGDSIARYAQHVDYHPYISEKLQEAWFGLVGRKVRAQFFVDSKPLAEKAYAALAGLGWIGKNTLLIHPKLGSYFLLGFIITELALEPDTPMKDMCGTCRRCLDACPTGALTLPRLLDSRLCISYHTIENKGDIPEELKEKMGTHIFGCDICQEVCPYNERASEILSFIPRAFESGEIGDLLSLDEEEFQKEFAGTPILRTGRRRLFRNIVAVLRNIGNIGRVV